MGRLHPSLLLVVASACVPREVDPSVRILTPNPDQVFAGIAEIPVRVDVDDNSASVRVDVTVDGEPAGEAVGQDCHRGCFVSVGIPALDLTDGEHVVGATAEDPSGRTAEAEPVTFSVRDIPYVEAMAVNERHEGALDGPDMEVEVHLLHDETAVWLGCAAMASVQQEGLLYEGLRVPFQANDAGDPLLFTDISFEVVRVVVIESDGGTHCPVWPELTDTLESDVDTLYGISPPVDLSLLYSGPVQPSVEGVTGLRIRRGRPFGQ